MSWQGWGLLVVLVGAAVASWLLGAGRGAGPAGAPRPPVPDAGYYFEDVSVLETGPDGAVVYEVDAETAVQSAADNAIALRRVHLDYNASGEGPWVLDAERGLIPQDRNLIELSGGVVLRSERGEVPTVVETERLTVDPERQLATTAGRVSIRVGSHTVTGTGMQARLDAQQLELEANVSGQFIP